MTQTIKFLSLSLLLLSACSGPRMWLAKEVRDTPLEKMPASSLSQTVYLIGDAGKAEEGDPVLEAVRSELKGNPADLVVYLGDNLYPYGLRPEGHPDRAADESHLRAQVDAVRADAESVLFVPGNHDWEQGGKEGLAHVRRGEAFVEEIADRKRFWWMPDGGCPGPVELPMGEDLTLIVLDTQWWLHRYEKPEDSSDCPADTEAEVLAQLEGALARNVGKTVLVVGHHPLYSYGAHGGKYPWYTHLFPLTMVKKKAFVPLPVLGTVAVLYRKLHGNIQDIPHPAYQHMREALLPVLEAHPGVVYACGHDHNLQYLPISGVDYIVSGSGSKSTHVGKGKNALFTTDERGFVRLEMFSDGKVLASFVTVDKEGLASIRFQRFLEGAAR